MATPIVTAAHPRAVPVYGRRRRRLVVVGWETHCSCGWSILVRRRRIAIGEACQHAASCSAAPLPESARAVLS